MWRAGAARPRKSGAKRPAVCGMRFVPEQRSALVAEALLLHVLQRSAQALVILIAQGDKAKWVSAGTDLRRQKFHQPADRTGERVYLGFSNGRAADAAGKFRQASGKGDLLRHGGNLMAAEVEANGFIVGNTYSGRTRPGLRLHLGKVRHEEIIVCLWRSRKITEALDLIYVALLQTARVGR